jgi:hypothetical protein
MRRQPERQQLIHSTVNTFGEILIMRPKGTGSLLVLRELQRFGTVSRLTALAACHVAAW